MMMAMMVMVTVGFYSLFQSGLILISYLNFNIALDICFIMLLYIHTHVHNVSMDQTIITRTLLQGYNSVDKSTQIYIIQPFSSHQDRFSQDWECVLVSVRGLFIHLLFHKHPINFVFFPMNKCITFDTFFKGVLHKFVIYFVVTWLSVFSLRETLHWAVSYLDSWCW